MKFSGKVCSGPMNKWVNFGGDPDQGSGWIRIGLQIRIRIATLARRALDEVCTVSVLLVIIVIIIIIIICGRSKTDNKIFTGLIWSGAFCIVACIGIYFLHNVYVRLLFTKYRILEKKTWKKFKQLCRRPVNMVSFWTLVLTHSVYRALVRGW